MAAQQQIRIVKTKPATKRPALQDIDTTSPSGKRTFPW